MKNLVFRFYLTVTLCWQCGIAERSANGYFYDKPVGTLFGEFPGTAQLLNSVSQFPPPRGGSYQQPLISAEVEIVPANLVYEDSQAVGGFQQQGNWQSPPDFAVPQQVYRGSGGQRIAFNLHDGSQAQSGAEQPCASEPIVAQYNPDFVDLSNGGPLTRLITTCGPHNDCNTIRLQSDVNRFLGVLTAQPKSGGFANAHSNQAIQARPRSYRVDIQAEESPLVRPPGRRLVKYTETERDDTFN